MADLNNLLQELEEDPLQQHDDNDTFLGKEQESGRPSIETAATEPLSAEDWDSPGTSRRFIAVPTALQEAKEKQQNGDQYYLTAETTNSQEEEGELNEIYTKLHQCWHQERHCPELLEYDSEMVEDIKRQMGERQEWIESSIEKLSSLDSGAAAVQNLLTTVAQVDLDRVKYVLANWMAERLAKIEAHPLHMRERVDHMSDMELEYLKQYGSLLEDHLRQTVLDHIPEAWQAMDEPHMIDQPDYEGYHFWLVHEIVEIDGTDFDVGSSLVAKYSVMRELMREGKVELQL